MNHLQRSFQILAVASALCSTAAHAQLIDQFDVRRDGNDAVLQLRFGTEVQFQRAVTTRAGDLTLVSYNLVSTVNSQVRTTQGMQLGAAEGLPRSSIADEAVAGERGRRLVIRTADGTRVEARAGAGNRSIEIVFKGAGAGVVRAAARAAPAPLPPSERRFAVLLLSVTEGSSSPPALTIPRALQDYDVFTRERTVDGQRQQETLLGYFANRTQAEAVLRQLGAFPQAAVVPMAPAAEPPVAVRPAPIVPAAPVGSPAAPQPPVAAAPDPAPATPAEVDARADALLARARGLLADNDALAAVSALNDLLNLPPNRRTAEAQELIGTARLRGGDAARARIEFETYLQLYPQGEGSERVRRALATLPTPSPTTAGPGDERRRAAAEITVTGSSSLTYYGGNGQIRSQDFKDSPIAGVPQIIGDPLLSDDKARQLLGDVDLTWRRRDTDNDVRFVFRDAYTRDLERSEKNKNRLSALYVDYKSLTGGYGVRLGRQSPTSGGVMGRFDGVSANVLLRPKLKLAGVAGVPTDKLFDSKRRFYGASLDSEGLLPNFGATVYTLEQRIDAEVDRRALGLEMRYFRDGLSVFSQFDYDMLIKGLNIATVQGTLVMDDGTTFNALYDKRALTLLALGNALTFEDPANPGVLYSRIADKLATTTLLALRDQIKDTTPFVTQAQAGFTKPVNKNWQVGGSASLTNTGAIPPVPGVVGFENGRPATGNIYTLGGQLIGLNLYSPRDTHVLALTAISSAALDGAVVSYNNSSIAWDVWQFEPSLQYYRGRTSEGGTSQRWTPGLRVTYRGWERWALESALTHEIGRASRVGPDPADPNLTVTTRETSRRINYALGARYSF